MESVLSASKSFEVEFLPNKTEKSEISDGSLTTFDAILNYVYCLVPIYFSILFQILISVINIAAVGKLNDTYSIAAVGLSNMALNMLIYCIVHGICGAIDTLVSNAYGAKQYYQCGVYLNRGRIMVMAICTPSIITLCFAKPLLLAMGQDPKVAEMVQNYIWYMMPGVITGMQLEIIKRFLQAMNVFYTITIMQVYLIIQHIFLLYLFIFKLNYGYLGAAIATVITDSLGVFILIGLTVFYKGLVHPDSVHFFNRDSFDKLGDFMRLGIPATIMISSEWASFEILSIFVGLLGVPQLGAHTALSSLIYFFYQAPVSCYIGSCMRVGNAVGENKPKTAEKYTNLIFIIGVLLGLVTFWVFYTQNNFIFHVMTNNEEVIGHMNSTLFVFCMLLLSDSVQGVLKGPLSAVGQQKLVGTITGVFYSLLGVSISVVMAFWLKMGLKGIWLGYTICSLMISACLLYLTFRVDWKFECLRAQKRIEV